jgi:Ca2+/H+ antiporter
MATSQHDPAPGPRRGTLRPFRRGTEDAPAPRWVGVLLGVCAVLFVPYIVALAFTLPSHARAAHYDAAWVGLDVFELLTLGATAWCAWTRSTWIALTATAAATLLVCDAWFDVVTSHAGEHRVLAIAAAVLVELPLATFCLWVARHAERVQERATTTLLRRSARQAEQLRAYEPD